MSRAPGPPKTPSSSGTREGWGAYTGIGVSFMAEIAVFGLIGWWCDGRFGTKPWLLVVGIFVGFLAATYHLVKMVDRIDAGNEPGEAPARRKEEDA